MIPPFYFLTYLDLDSVSQLKQYLDINVVFWNGFFDIFFDCIIYGTYLKSIISIVSKPKTQEVSSDFQKFS